MANELKKGDVVMLNSGSPNLTVTEIDTSTNMVWVEWIYEGERKYERFPFACVKKVPESTT